MTVEKHLPNFIKITSLVSLCTIFSQFSPVSLYICFINNIGKGSNIVRWIEGFSVVLIQLLFHLQHFSFLFFDVFLKFLLLAYMFVVVLPWRCRELSIAHIVVDCRYVIQVQFGASLILGRVDLGLFWSKELLGLTQNDLLAKLKRVDELIRMIDWANNNNCLAWNTALIDQVFDIIGLAFYTPFRSDHKFLRFLAGLLFLLPSPVQMVSLLPLLDFDFDDLLRIVGNFGLELTDLLDVEVLLRGVGVAGFVATLEQFVLRYGDGRVELRDFYHLVAAIDALHRILWKLNFTIIFLLLAEGNTQLFLRLPLGRLEKDVQQTVFIHQILFYLGVEGYNQNQHLSHLNLSLLLCFTTGNLTTVMSGIEIFIIYHSSHRFIYETQASSNSSQLHILLLMLAFQSSSSYVLGKADANYSDYYIQQCMPKKVARRKDSDEDSEEVEDIMAWGKKKENYYKDSQNQYSSLEEEEQEARKIYEHQLEQLQDPELYEIPQPQSEEDVSQDEEGTSDKGLSHAYLTKEIKAMVKLGLKISEEPDSKARSLLETYIQSYLMALIALRELKIPYIEYHPIVNKALQLKEDIGKLKHLLESSTVHDGEHYKDEEEELIEEQAEDEDEENAEEQQDEEQQLEDEDEFENDYKIKEGLKIYEETKAKQEEAKKIKKGLKKVEREGKKKPAFAEVKGNEGRLANEKILKNKGLIKKRKKMDRNSRVKLRRKFDKASSKRRAYGHFIRENPGREYQGERNIKYGRIASVKLK